MPRSKRHKSGAYHTSETPLLMGTVHKMLTGDGVAYWSAFIKDGENWRILKHSISTELNLNNGKLDVLEVVCTSAS